MTDARHLCRPEGWRMTYRDKVCTALLPEPGTTILIAKASKGYSAMWIDGQGELKTMSFAPVDDHWECRKKLDGQSYVVTATVTSGADSSRTMGASARSR